MNDMMSRLIKLVNNRGIVTAKDNVFYFNGFVLGVYNDKIDKIEVLPHMKHFINFLENKQ